MRRAVLFAVLALGFAGCVCGAGGTPDETDHTVDPDDPVLEPDIDRCFQADGLCEQLCRDLLAPPPEGFELQIDECFVNRQDDGLLNVHATARLVEECF
jgi:hypothetical protein